MKSLKIIGLLMFLLTLYSCDCCSDSDPTGTISEAEASGMQSLFSSEFAAALEEAGGTTQPQRIDFPIEELEKYICKVKDSASALGYSGPLGLSVNFGAKDESINPNDEKFEITVYFSPTSRAGGSICEIQGITRLNYGSGGQILTCAP